MDLADKVSFEQQKLDEKYIRKNDTHWINVVVSTNCDWQTIDWSLCSIKFILDLQYHCPITGYTKLWYTSFNQILFELLITCGPKVSI